MLKIAVLVSGGGTNLQAILDAIRDGVVTDTEVAVVISNNANAYALTRAAEAGVPGTVISPKDYPDRETFGRALAECAKAHGATLAVLAGYLVQIPVSFLRAFPNAVLNIHPALIPSFSGKGYYGLHVHEAALARGVKVTGATVHFVNENLDEGPILLQKAVEVREGDTPAVLQRRVMEEAEWILLPKAIDLIAHGKVTVSGGLAHISE